MAFGSALAFRTDKRIEKASEAPDDRDGIIAAINRSQAVIEFTLDGKTLNANENFLGALGYTLAEIQGQHHSLFVDPVDRGSHACGR